MKTHSINEMIPTEFPPLDSKGIIKSFNKALKHLGKQNFLIPEHNKHYKQALLFDQMAKYYVENATRYIINEQILNDEVDYVIDPTKPLYVPTKNVAIITKALKNNHSYEVFIYNDVSTGAKSDLATKLGPKLGISVDPNLTGILFHFVLDVHTNTLISPFVAFEYKEGLGFTLPAVFKNYLYEFAIDDAQVSKEYLDSYLNSTLVLFVESLNIINNKNIIVKPMVVSKVKQRLNKSKFTKYGNEYKLVELDQTKIVKPYYSTSDTLQSAHKSPRMHERTGHWRHYKSGKRTWVKSCVVGDPAKGIITKDYNVHKSKSEDINGK